MGVSNFDLFLAMIRNRKAVKVNREMVGFFIEETVGPVTKEEAALYAKATNDDNPIYEKEEDLTPPMYIARLVHPLMMQIMVHKKLKLNLLRMVHGQQSVDWHASSLKAGDMIDVRLQIDKIEDTSAGDFMGLSFTAKVEGTLVASATIGLLIRGNVKGSKKKKPAEEKREPFIKMEIPTTEDQALRYAEASGDHNFIHKSNFLAKMSGLPRTILHGMCALAMATNGLAKQLADSNIKQLEHIEVRFANPTFPGEPLTLVIYEKTENGFPFEMLNKKGKPVLKKGLVRLK